MRFYIPLKLFAISLESNGVEKVEYELEVYGKIVNFSEIEKLSVRNEYQEQYAIKKPRGTVRVRMTKDDSGTRYEMTTKTWDAQRNKRKEAELEVTEAMFEHFKSISDSGMIKRRYFIPFGQIVEELDIGEITTDLNWEVDVFLDLEGNRQEWCKIDLEGLPENVDLPELPIQLDEAITNQYGDRTPEEIDKLTDLFKNVFSVYPEGKPA